MINTRLDILGITSKQLSLDIISRHITLGITTLEGFYVPPNIDFALLLEDGDFLLQENGDYLQFDF